MIAVKRTVMLEPGRNLLLPLGSFSCQREYMTKSIRGYAKKQRTEAAGTMVGVRLQPDQLTALDAWIKHQPDTLSRPEGVRRLMEIGLKGQ
jgi:cytochrome c553